MNEEKVTQLPDGPFSQWRGVTSANFEAEMAIAMAESRAKSADLKPVDELAQAEVGRLMYKLRMLTSKAARELAQEPEVWEGGCQ